MSALADAPAVAAPRDRPLRDRPRRAEVERPRVRLVTFVALAAYGLSRWATLLKPAPGWRLLGLLGLAAALAGGVGWLSRRSRLAAGLAVVLIVLLAFGVAGVSWHSLHHLRIKVTSDEIGNGLEALPNALVPYLGASAAVRLDILLGAAVLVLDAAAVVAFAGRPGLPFGDGRRAAAALPLIALAVVPSTLVRPGLPYLQGLLLFGLIAAFQWGERVRSVAAGSAILVLIVGGIAAALLAPRIDPHHAWVDYRAWAGGRGRPRSHTASFDWNQTYGPLNWPHAGHTVMIVIAPRPDYWKAENLDQFDGTGWRYGVSAPIGPLPSPPAATQARFTQTIDVHIEGMRTPEVISAGTASPPSGSLPGGYAASLDPGAWTADRPLGPGTTYRITTYSPRPTDAQLARAGRRYPVAALAGDLTLQIPQPGVPHAGTVPVRFPLLGSGGTPSIPGPAPGGPAGVFDASAQSYVPPTPPARSGGAATAVLDSSPYARAYALARRLAAAAPTPEAYVQAVMRYLSVARGFVYDQNPRLSRYPLETFLFSTRRGYCQQFSGAMALLLRMGGVPARVVSGFTPGVQTKTQFVVSDIDAHAWVEVWFPGYGWVRRDPTPSVDPALSGSPATAGASGASNRSVDRRFAPARRSGGSATSATSSSSPARAAAGSDDPGWTILLTAALIVLGGVLAVRLAGGLAPVDPVAELERAMARTRRPLAAGTTLRSIERRLGASPDAAAYVHALAARRYGAGGVAPTAAQRRALRRELARGLGLGGRLRALWALPPRRGSGLRRD